MADDDLLVTISGPALSLLLFENARWHDQIGFLLGEMQMFITKKVTDFERTVKKIQRHINIKSIVVYPMGCEPFFNTTGQLNEICLKEFLKDDIDKVVGWYHYRYDSEIKIDSLRDRTLHTDLSEFFSKLHKHQEREHFLFFFMVTTENETHATHKFKHTLFRKEGRDYKPVSFRINNLGADASRPDGSDYKPTPEYTSCKYDSFNEVYAPLQNDLKKLSGVESVQLIEKSAEDFLARLIPQVNKTDTSVTELSERLFKMKQDYYKTKFEKEVETYMQQFCMAVNTQQETQSSLAPLIIKSESINSDSSSILDWSKVLPSSSNMKLATTKNLKQESNEELIHDVTTSERKNNQTKIDLAHVKTVSQRRDELLQAAQNSMSSFDKKGSHKSSDYETKKS